MSWTWFWKLTGGRPMIHIGYAFMDRVSGQQVNYYMDRLGRGWLACGPWDLFRVSNKGGDK